MSVHQDAAIAFARPGGERCEPSRLRPVDLVHLARQTLGDRALEQEVLNLFLQQALAVRNKLPAAGIEERRRLAHGLRGAASGVGAFEVAQCAAAIEESPADKSGVERLSLLVDEARDFIAAISR